MEFNGTFLASIVSFLVFMFLMDKILYTPIKNIIAERAGLIEGNYQEAELNNNKAKELSSERELKLEDAKNDAREKYISIVDEYKDKKQSLIVEAQEKVHNDLELAYQHLENVSNEAKEELKHKMTALSNDIVEKVLGYRSEVQGFDNDTVNRILYH